MTGKRMRWMTRLADALPVAVLGYVAAAFLLSTEPASALVFYLGVAPAVLAHLVLRRWAGLAVPGVWLALILAAWSGLTLLWGEDPSLRWGQFALASLATILFVVAVPASVGDARSRERLADVLIWAGAANAAIALLRDHTVNGRLHGWGVTEHPILGGSAMAIAWVTAVWRMFGGDGRKWPYVAAGVVMGGFLVLTVSRGPLLGAVCGGAVVAAASPVRRKIALGILALAVSAAPLLLWRGVRDHLYWVLWHRNWSHHPEIWRFTWMRIRVRPWFGHGLAADLAMGGGISFPHSLYLSLWFYSGAAGVLLFAAWAGAVGWRLWRYRVEPHALWAAAICVCGGICGLTDLGQITKGPGAIWIIVWLPGLLAARLTGARDRGVAWR